MAKRSTLLIISQVYVPDPTAVGQYMHDAAAEMVNRGWRVVVYTSRTGYDDPSQRFARRETRDGVEIRRLPFSSFGKSSIKVRLLAQLLFIFQATSWGLWTRGLKTVLVSTSPPMAGIGGVVIQALRGASLKFWAMDINPDQAVAMGAVGPESAFVKLFDAMNRSLLKRSSAVVALDRFMAQTLEKKVSEPVGERMHVIPPWPLEGFIEPVPHDQNPFRSEHGLEGKFVVMYSGNISPAHPLDTVLEAAVGMGGQEELVLLFIGGKAARERIEAFAEERGCSNILTLPYQPIERIKYSLSAADVHLVAMGDEMVGLVHPCKVYGAMAVARPILGLGPSACHVGEIVASDKAGWMLEHGDVEGCKRAYGAMLEMGAEELKAMGARCRTAVDLRLSKDALCSDFCDLLEARAG